MNKIEYHISSITSRPRLETAKKNKSRQLNYPNIVETRKLMLVYKQYKKIVLTNFEYKNINFKAFSELCAVTILSDQINGKRLK